MPLCANAEQRLLAGLPDVCKRRNTSISWLDGDRTWLHAVELPAPSERSIETPGVFLPGYGTGAAIFAVAWRQMMAEGGSWAGGLRPPLWAVDPLGWYLSGRPRWTPGADVSAAEAWFVDSLESWRVTLRIEVMDLVGHSIGGNIAAAYAEHYPKRVRTLILISPAGMPAEPPDYREKLQVAPWKPFLMLTLWGRGWTPALGLKLLPKRYGHRIASMTANRWSAGAPEGTVDREALADYIYYGWCEGKESGEQALTALLHPGAWGKRPLVERLPNLKVARVELIYGDSDWMDVRHGNTAAAACEKLAGSAPAVFVQLVEAAGHYVHLQNTPGFCRALALALARAPDSDEPRCAAVPAGFCERFVGESVPMWRRWENYEFGR